VEGRASNGEKESPVPPSASVAAAVTSPITDAEIVRRVRGSEVALFEILMRRHNPLLYRTIRSFIRDEAEVEDAMQQAYLRAFTHLEEFQGLAAFSTWLVRIAVNEALGRVRAGSRVSLVEEFPASEESVRVRLHRAHLSLRDALFARVRSSARDAFPFLAPRCDRIVAGVLGRIGRTATQ
jgi:DNA-directed RNA polymerase specialized sigma24 family protein